MKHTIIVDLDGTLANIDHRLHLVKADLKRKNFDEFYRRLVDDLPNEWCAVLMDVMMRQGYDVTVVSARPKKCLADTQRWLADHSISYSHLHLVRDDGDYRPDQELKRAFIRARGKDDVLFVVDDRQRVVDMWREEGLVCLQCAQWEEYKEFKKPAKTVDCTPGCCGGESR